MNATVLLVDDDIQLFERLEKEHPHITHVERDDDGAITLQEWNGDPEELMREICAHLDRGK